MLAASEADARVPPLPRSFCARRSCAARAYPYLRPLRALTAPAPPPGLAVGAPGPPPQAADAALVAQRLAALDAALRSFEGTHAFHNFTKRSRYAPPPGANAAPGLLQGAGPEEGLDDDVVGGEEDGDEDAPPASADVGSGAAWAAPPDVVGTYEPGGMYWLTAPPEAGGDRLGPSHFRTVLRCRAAAAPEALPLPGGGGGEPFVRISVEGESFMLHQIRKMVATAVAVARGALPAAFIPAALAKPCRTRTPVAPASTLVLSGATFMPFRPDTSKAAAAAGSDGAASPPAQRALASPAHVAAAVEAWSAQQLLPSLAPALASAEWEDFVRNLGTACPPAADVEAVLGAAAAWHARPQPSPKQREQRRQQREQRARR